MRKTRNAVKNLINFLIINSLLKACLHTVKRKSLLIPTARIKLGGIAFPGHYYSCTYRSTANEIPVVQSKLSE